MAVMMMNKPKESLYQLSKDLKVDDCQWTVRLTFICLLCFRITFQALTMLLFQFLLSQRGRKLLLSISHFKVCSGIVKPSRIIMK